MIRETPFIVVDTETTGSMPAQDRVIEIGAVKLLNNEIVDTFHTLINPECFIPYNVIQIHNITDDMVISAPRFHEIAMKFKAFMGEQFIFVGHNVDFDLKFLNSEFSRCRIPGIDQQTLCTIKLARKYYPEMPKYNLRTVAQMLNIPLERAHRALEDSKTSAKILLKIIQKLESENKFSVEDLQLKPLRIEASLQMF